MQLTPTLQDFPDELLRIRDLTVVFPKTAPGSPAVNNVSVTMRQGQTLGLVGESGSGKSTVCLAIMGLTPPGTTVTGEVSYRGVNLLELPERQLRAARQRHRTCLPRPDGRIKSGQDDRRAAEGAASPPFEHVP